MWNKIKYFIHFLIANSISKSIGFIALIYMSIIFTEDKYAIFSIYYTIYTLVIAFTSAGLIESYIGFIKKFENNVSYLNKILILTFLIYSIFALTITFIYSFLSDKKFIDILIVSISAILISLGLVLSNIKRLAGDFKASLYLYTIVPTIGFLLGFSFIYVYKYPILFFLGILVGILFSIPIGKLFKIDIFLSIKTKKESIFLYSFVFSSFPYILINIVNWISGYGVNILIEIFLIKSSIAKFTFLYSVSSILQLIATSFNQVWSYYVIKNFREIKDQDGGLFFINKRNKKVYSLLTFILTIISIILFYTFIIIGNSNLDILKNVKYYINFRNETLLLFISYIIMVPWWLSSHYFFFYKKNKVILYITLISNFLWIITFIILVKHLGDIGIYISFIIKNFIFSFLILFFSIKYWNIKFPFISMVFSLSILILCYNIIY